MFAVFMSPCMASNTASPTRGRRSEIGRRGRRRAFSAAKASIAPAGAGPGANSAASWPHINRRCTRK